MTKRKDYRLTDAGVKALAKQMPPQKIIRHSDGNNLYLIQHPNGSLFWQVTYRYQSDKDLKPEQNTYQIGIYKSARQTIDSTFKPEVSLKEVRLARDKAQALLNDGIHPTEHKNHEKNNFEQKDLFRVIAKSYVNERSSTTPKNIQKLHNYLDKHIAPHIGDYPIASITAQDVIKTGLATQTYFEKRGKWTTDTSHKCVALISSVFEYAINTLGYNIINTVQIIQTRINKLSLACS